MRNRPQARRQEKGACISKDLGVRGSGRGSKGECLWREQEKIGRGWGMGGERLASKNKKDWMWKGEMKI